MKIKIGKALDQGFQVLFKNPVVLAPFVGLAAIQYFFYQYTLWPMMKSFQNIPGFNNDFNLPMVSPVGAQIMPNWPITPDFSGIPFRDDVLYPFALTASIFTNILKVMPFLALGLVIGIILYLAAIRLIAETAKNNPPNLGSALILGLKKFIPIIISGILSMAMIMIGYVFLILPGLYLTIRFMFFVQAAMIDDQGIISSLDKSWQVTRGNWWRSLGIIVIPTVVAGIIGTMMGAILPLFTSPASNLVTVIVNTFFMAWVMGVTITAYLQIHEPEEPGQA